MPHQELLNTEMIRIVLEFLTRTSCCILLFMAILNTGTVSNYMLSIEGGTYPIAHPSFPGIVNAFYRI